VSKREENRKLTEKKTGTTIQGRQFLGGKKEAGRSCGSKKVERIEKTLYTQRGKRSVHLNYRRGVGDRKESAESFRRSQKKKEGMGSRHISKMRRGEGVPRW